MSTKEIRRALELLANRHVEKEGPQALAALAEVVAIEKSCLTLYRYGVVNPELGEEHETTPALDEAADYLMKIGLEQMP